MSTKSLFYGVGDAKVRSASAEIASYFETRVSQTDLARQAGVSRQYVQAVAARRRSPSKKLVRAAAELGIVNPLVAAIDLARPERTREH